MRLFLDLRASAHWSDLTSGPNYQFQSGQGWSNTVVMIEQCVQNLRSVTICNLCVGSPDINNSSTESASRRSLNTFFTIHTMSDELLYVSEVITAFSHARFGSLSVRQLQSRIFKVKLRLWTNTERNDNYSLFFELALDLRNLIALEKKYVHSYDCDFVPNTVLWSIDDHNFVLPADVRNQKIVPEIQRPGRKKSVVHSYSADDIRQLNNLINGIREFQSLKASLTTEIETANQELSSNHDAFQTEEKEKIEVKLKTLGKIVARQESVNNGILSQVLHQRKKLKHILALLDEESVSFEEIYKERLEIVSSQIGPLFDSLNRMVYPQLLELTRDMVSTIGEAFPIELEPSGRYCISGIEFPSNITEILKVCHERNSKLKLRHVSRKALEDVEETYTSIDLINAGLSNIVHLMNLLAMVFNITFKYSMTFGGSLSYIVERFSQQQITLNKSSGQRTNIIATEISHPLFFIGDGEDDVVLVKEQLVSANAQFERGLSLLSRNVRLLVSEVTNLYSQYHFDEKVNRLTLNTVPVECSDDFLWNLQFIILFITAPRKS